MKKHFVQNQKVMIRRLGDDKEYRGRVVGISAHVAELSFYIVEVVDKLPGYNWTHCTIPEVCLDAENW